MLPDWVDKRYKILWDSFQSSPFRLEEAAKILNKGIDDIKDSKKEVVVILSELKKEGILKVNFDPDDARKRIYELRSKKDIISDTLAFNKKKLTRGELERILKSAADLIRTRVDYSFILVLLFYKRMSDKWEVEYKNAYDEAIDDGLSEEEAKKEARNSAYHDYNIPENFLWDKLRKKDPARIPENFSAAMKAIASSNSDLKIVFESIDFIQFTTSRENAEILRQLIELFSEKSLHNVSPDILGDAYEWILRYFAPQKAKEGEVYTAREVIKLIVEMLDPQPGQSVYDPACGSGGMHISSYRHIKDKLGGDSANKLFLYGQEAKHMTLALAKMNLNIHDIRNANIVYGDTLNSPKFKDESGEIKKFDIVIANPPWNQDGYDEKVLRKGEFCSKRFRYGFTPKQSADWAWIQHMLTSAKEEAGKVGVVIDNGCLFRGGKEKAIRSKIVGEDLIETIILLPEKLFYNTPAPGAIIIFNRSKPCYKKDKIQFINASEEYESHPEVRKLNILGDKNLDRIVKAYKSKEEQKGFSQLIGKDKIKENDYNLNVTLYVYPEEEIEEIDISKEWQDMKSINQKLSENEKKIADYLKELEIDV
ncbi:MAG: class I SAM-dependent DNA methyltransferase [Actinomycetota bacterium]|nr:class I SAM-dependent DNA methyltransferase [Actinomycetota bacterium]